MNQVVELDIPAQPEFVGIARMAVSALAGIRPGLAYERVDDLRIVVSEACTDAIEAATGRAPGATGREGPRVVVRCLDGPEALEVRIEGPAGAFDLGGDAAAGGPEEFRISLIRALVDEAEVRPSPAGSELRLVLLRESAGDDGDLPA